MVLSLLSPVFLGDAEVAEEAVAFGTEEGGAGESFFESGVVHALQLFRGEKLLVQSHRRHRGRLGKAVPGAGFQTAVAAEEAVSHGRVEFGRDVAPVFDGQVGKTAARVQMARGQRPGGTSPQTALTGAALEAERRIGFQLQSGDDLGKKEPAAQPGTDQVVVFADEAQAGPLRQVAFQQMGGVAGKDGGDMRGGAFDVFNKAAELAERFPQGLVIIGHTRVACHGGILRSGQIIAGGQTDDSPGIGQSIARIQTAADAALAFHPAHPGMASLGQPLEEDGGGGRRFRRGEAAVVEAEPPGLFDDLFFGFRGGHLFRRRRMYRW